jgi:hypothetical protein
MSSILALDLGTKTGWAFGPPRDYLVPEVWGTWTLAKAKEIREQAQRNDDRNCDCRLARLLKLLEEWVKPGTLIVFEDVQFATTSMQAHLWATFRAAVWAQKGRCEDIRAVPVGTLKKFATGKGNATKPMMAAHLQGRLPWVGIENLDDNAVDAVWLWLYAKEFLT